MTVTNRSYSFWEKSIPSTYGVMSTQRWHFAAQRGYFTHDNDPESWEFRATTRPKLGLTERSYPTDGDFWTKEEGESREDLSQTQWRRLQHYITSLNNENPDYKRYILLYIVRHGQGVHNVKESEVGREEWNRYWAKLPGDSTATWLDADLTAQGEQQASAISSLWADNGIQPPHSVYSSPLRRCLRTTKLAFAFVSATPVIKEKLRERLGMHTCDKRSSRSWIAGAYPTFQIEHGLSEEDVLWQSDRRENLEEHVQRSKELLDDIFTNDDSQVVALVAHSGATMALFGATGWRKVPVAAGAVYPLLVCGTKVTDGGDELKVFRPSAESG